ncbi:MAG: LysR family transcriptional regulator [Gammaproteobacteria bacterium]|nr:LysR family transcriptional regulator [Gammaproteobacteria bacterium]
MTLRELRYLVALADHGHFGRAAAACHASQPTLSTQLRKLEDYLGAELIERGGRTTRLTPLGQDIAARARHIVDEADGLIAAARAHAAPLVGPLHAGIISTLSPYFLPWLLPVLRLRFPQLQLAVQEASSQPLLERLEQGHLDAAITALPVDGGDYDAAPLFDEPYWLAVPQDHPLATRSDVRFDELSEERLLLLDDMHCRHGQALPMCSLERADDAPRFGDFRETSLETLCRLVAQGIGCTLVPALARRSAQMAAPGLIVIPLRSPGAMRRLGLVWRRTSWRRTEFMQLAQSISRDPPPGTLRFDRRAPGRAMPPPPRTVLGTRTH